MVTPPASSKPCFLEKVARSTLVLCHASPQERPTGRSGTASAGSGKSAEAEDPSFFRDSSWRLGRLVTAGAAPILPTDRWFVYQTQKLARRSGNAIHPGWPLGVFRGSGSGCYTHRLACRKAYSHVLKPPPTARSDSEEPRDHMQQRPRSRSDPRPRRRRCRATASAFTSGRSAAR